ncbi:MAG: DUF72 domain-containing protein [Candidatus Kapaibacteriota bacterium]|jgi:uncharacterized protein YecE (DUF72 family)
MNIYIGTSGWAFPNWVGVLYPEGLPQNKWLNFYSQIFNCVEVNSTFYRLFKPSTYLNWAKTVGNDFKFIIKVPQEISHKKKLVNAGKELDEFFENIENLRPKIGLVLLQLPPSFSTPIDIFSDVIAYISSKFPLAVEFRNKYSRSEEVLDILIRNNCVYVNPDSPNNFLTNILTNRTLYYRLHGRIALHKSSYNDEELEEIASSIKTFEGRIDNAYIIFNNGMLGYSIPNAVKLQSLLRTTRECNGNALGNIQKLEF